MPDPRRYERRTPPWWGAGAGLHVVALLVALAVPGYAVIHVLGLAVGPSAADDFLSAVDPIRWLSLVKNTAVVCGVAVATSLSLGTLLGLLAARTDAPGRRVLVGTTLFAACMPFYASQVFFFSVVPVFTLQQSAAGCGLLYGLLYTPLATLLLAVVFWSADRELEDQALLDVGAWRVWLHVTMPQARWGLIVV